MNNDTFANRLQKALDKKGWKPADLIRKTGLDKSLISNYLSGNYKAKQDKLTILADALDTNEVWLMGYDVQFEPYNNVSDEENAEILTKLCQSLNVSIDGLFELIDGVSYEQVIENDNIRNGNLVPHTLTSELEELLKLEKEKNKKDLSILDNVLYSNKNKINSVKNLSIEDQKKIANAVQSVLDMIDEEDNY